VKTNALFKPRHSHPLFIIALEIIEVFLNKRKKEKGPPLEIPICDVSDAPPNSLLDSITKSKCENNERIKSRGTHLSSQHFGGKGAC
jgi:hypothetical protein